MAETITQLKEFIERDGARYDCYRLLKNVQFAGEPVVPRITSESREDEFLGKVFGVETLPGTDLDSFLLDREIKFRDKMGVLSYVVGQLQEVDKAGFVLFDRAARNIRLLSWGNLTSARQIDIEDMYDKRQGKLYGVNWKMDIIRELQARGVDFWAPSVDVLTSCVSMANSSPDRNYNTANAFVSRHRWEKGKKGSNLYDFGRELRGLI